jgi:cytochrome c oxidase subunit IV
MSHTTEHLEHTDAPSDMKAQIWKTFWILLGFTIVDIVLYFVIPASMMRNWTFIILGVVKAFFIVSIFMHMKFERKFLAWMIILPMSFVIYLITLMVIEGRYTDDSRNIHGNQVKTEQHHEHGGEEPAAPHH